MVKRSRRDDLHNTLQIMNVKNVALSVLAGIMLVSACTPDISSKAKKSSGSSNQVNPVPAALATPTTPEGWSRANANGVTGNGVTMQIIATPVMPLVNM